MANIAEELKKKGKKKTQKTVLSIAGSVTPVFLGVIAVCALAAAAMAFAEWLMGVFTGVPDAEVLYSWAKLNYPGAAEQLSNIEGMPYTEKAVECAFRYEVAGTDDHAYLIDVQDEDGVWYNAEYNLKALTSNYALPWQLSLSICTANQFSDVDDFLGTQERQQTDSNFKYTVEERDISKVGEMLNTKLFYITDYSMYGLANSDDGADSVYGILGGGPSYKDFEKKAITELDDSYKGEYACIYKENDDGVGIYYPVAVLDHVQTYLYDYKFNYSLDLDDEDRPIAYHLESVTKTTRVGGDDGLLAVLSEMGIPDSSTIELLTLILDMMPYASDRGMATDISDAVAYYNKNGEEYTESVINYDEDLAIQAIDSKVYSAVEIDEIIEGYHDDKGIEVTTFNKDGHLSVPKSYLWSRADMVKLATEFVDGIYYNAMGQDSVGDVSTDFLDQYRACKYEFSEKYPLIGQVVDTEFEADEDASNGYFVAGMLRGLSDWEFVDMILSETLYTDFSKMSAIAFKPDDSELGYTTQYETIGDKKSDGTFVSRWLNWTCHAGIICEGQYSWEEYSFRHPSSLYWFARYERSNDRTDCVELVNYNSDTKLSDTEDIGKYLIPGDIGMYVSDGVVKDCGIYVGLVNGYPSFIHVSPSSSAYASYLQGRCQISYLECTANGTSHPDGGTVDYNCFVRVKQGSYYVDGTNGMTSYTDTGSWEAVCRKLRGENVSSDELGGLGDFKIEDIFNLKK